VDRKRGSSLTLSVYSSGIVGLTTDHDALAGLTKPVRRFFKLTDKGVELPPRTYEKTTSTDYWFRTAGILARHIRVDLSRCLCELSLFDARLYVRVRCVDEPA
jgi:hypothetical protein